MRRVVAGADVYLDGAPRPLDLVIDGETVEGLVTRGSGPVDADWIDARGLLAIPGGIDVHVHTREPGYTHKEDIATATRAAAAGGYTTIFGMPNLDPPTMTGEDLYMVVDTGRSYPHPAAIGVHDHGELYQAMQAVAGTGLRLMVHPHDQAIMDVVEQGFWAEGDRSPWAYGQTLAAGDGLIWDTATATLLRLAEATGCRLHIVHTQTIRQIEMITEARQRGVDVTCETNHWTLFLGTREDIEQQGSYVLSYWVPPHHQAAVWAAIAEGTIDLLASDHAPHTREEKEVGWTDAWAAHTGTPGVQEQLPLLFDAMHHGRISLARLVDAVAAAPARAFGISRKGSLVPGNDADIVLVDPARRWTITDDVVLSKIGWTPYAGREVTGAVVRTVVRGRDVWVEDVIVGEPGWGRQVGVHSERGA